MSKSKKNKAVALKYNVEEDTSPVVIASGYGTVAEKIIDIAEKKGIPVFKDDSAASLLCMLEVGSNIPVDLYEVVAAIYCKLLETSAKIKSEEAFSRSERARAKGQTRGQEQGRTLLRSRNRGRGEEQGAAGESGRAGEEQTAGRKEAAGENGAAGRTRAGEEHERQSVKEGK